MGSRRLCVKVCDHLRGVNAHQESPTPPPQLWIRDVTFFFFFGLDIPTHLVKSPVTKTNLGDARHGRAVTKHREVRPRGRRGA